LTFREGVLAEKRRWSVTIPPIAVMRAKTVSNDALVRDDCACPLRLNRT